MKDGAQLELPALPGDDTARANIISPGQFTRKKLKVLLHLITGELKLRGTKTPHIFLPFRLRIDDAKLDGLLTRLFPAGDMVLGSDDKIQHILKATDEFTLILGLRYLWCRLPNSEVIGWDVYLEYKRKEKEAGYPKDAFLTIMPKCLLLPAHALIVYDFLDLLIGIASNSQYNYLSGRKIAKMSSLWAFNGTTATGGGAAGSAPLPFYDATVPREYNFLQGLEVWKATLDALFHLLLLFLRAMLPDNDMDTLKLPKTLQLLLITNLYPPVMTDLIKLMITIPCVLIKLTKVLSNPYELISKVRHTLLFEKKNLFLLIENYTILKNIFQKNLTLEIIGTLTEELRRVLTRITKDPTPLEYDLYPGWTRHAPHTDADIPLYLQITIHDVTLQDYYIWTWLLTLGLDQTLRMKGLFGRLLVVEAGLKGFQKWLIISEETMLTQEYLNTFKQTPLLPKLAARDSRELSELAEPRDRRHHRQNLRRVPKDIIMHKEVPPLPADPGLLPDFDFAKDDLRLVTTDGYDFLLENEDISSDYKTYLQSLLDFNEDDVALLNVLNDKLYFSQRSLAVTRRPPPMADDDRRPPLTPSFGDPRKDNHRLGSLFDPKPLTPVVDRRAKSPRRRSPERARSPRRPSPERLDSYDRDERPREDTLRPIKLVEEIRELMDRDVEEKQRADRKKRRPPPQNLELDLQIEEELEQHRQRLPHAYPPYQAPTVMDNGYAHPPQPYLMPHLPMPPPQGFTDQAFPTLAPGTPKDKGKQRLPRELSPDPAVMAQPHNRQLFIQLLQNTPGSPEEPREGLLRQLKAEAKAEAKADAKARRKHIADKDELPPLPEEALRPPTPPIKPSEEPRKELKRPLRIPQVERIPAPQFLPPRQTLPQDKQAKPPRQPKPRKPLGNYNAFPKPGAAPGIHQYGAPPKGQQFSYGFGGPQYYYNQQPGHQPGHQPHQPLGHQPLGHQPHPTGHPHPQYGMPPHFQQPPGFPPYGYPPQGQPMPQGGYFMTPPHVSPTHQQFGQYPGYPPQRYSPTHPGPPMGAPGMPAAGMPAAGMAMPAPGMVPPGAAKAPGVPSDSTLMKAIPQAGRHDKNKTTNMAQMRAALNQMG